MSDHRVLEDALLELGYDRITPFRLQALQSFLAGKKALLKKHGPGKFYGDPLALLQGRLINDLTTDIEHQHDAAVYMENLRAALVRDAMRNVRPPTFAETNIRSGSLNRRCGSHGCVLPAEHAGLHVDAFGEEFGVAFDAPRLRP